MQLDASKIKFSNKDLRLKIILPKFLSPELAYFIGVHVGDGTIPLYKKQPQHYMGYTGHLIDEYAFHINTIKPFIKNLFNKEVKIQKDLRKNRTSIRTYFRSKAIFYFLSEVIGLTVGSKSNSGIPTIIKNSNEIIKINFIKGLIDTDGSLTFKRKYRNLHYYPTISLASKSRQLIEDANIILKELGFETSLNHISYLDSRTKLVYTRSTVELNGINNLSLWINKVGFNSNKHLTKYRVWEKFGYCPPYTNIYQRIEMLNS